MVCAARPNLLSHALTAAARFPVFPVLPGRKEPALSRWPARATRDRSIVHRWWEAHPDRNVGVRTGPTLLVVDLDVAGHGAVGPAGDHLVDGATQLRRLAHEHGDESLWGVDGRPRTYTVETPSAGLHLYFRVPERACCRNTQGYLGARIDTRGVGGFVVAAGSLGPDGRAYRAVVHRPIAVAPDWLIAALRPPPPPAPRAAVRLADGDAVARYVARAVREECAEVRAAAPGGRNTALLRASRIVGEFVGAGALGEDVAATALGEAAAVHVGVHGFTEREAARTIRSGLAYGQRRPRDLGGVARSR